MVPNKSLDDSINLIAALLCDVHSLHGSVFNTKALRLTLQKVKKRAYAEGMGYLTKSLPRLAKALDKALAGDTKLNSTDIGFERIDESNELPRFLGEFFNRVLLPDGTVRSHPCETSVGVIRQICLVFYKYELPYTDEQEQQVISKFEKTENDLSATDVEIERIHSQLLSRNSSRRWSLKEDSSASNVAREARILLNRLFSFFDPKDIHPRHGPGAVATKQQRSEKYQWTNVSAKITEVYPFDAYFCASLGHVCDKHQEHMLLGDKSFPAKVILVPKDSRGPRLISCEPVDFQWIQQGLGRAIVDLVERHPLTRGNVRFTDQEPNRIAAKYGSESGRYATLDLNEASDRVSLALVRLLFPEHVLTYLEACRTSSTVLPSGKELTLRKFAPMGSSLCFPILALTIWAILTAATDDADTRESIYVYGDDVIVPTAFAANAIEQLETFGLRVNRDKSCTGGLFRESCGMDAFNGVEVTPVRLRTVWSSIPRPESFSSWVSYANSFWDRKYYQVYDYIADRLHSVYGDIPDDDMQLACPSLRYVPADKRPRRSRTNKRLQKREWLVTDVKAPVHIETMDGWSKLLRYFAEATQDHPLARFTEEVRPRTHTPFGIEHAFSVSQYTSRRASKLVRRWR